MLTIANALDVIGVPWAIGGSVAGAAYGEPRATNDVVAAEAARRRSSFNVIDNRSFLKVDVFVPAAGALGAGQLDRRRHLELLAGREPLPVLAPEDVILQKLRW